MSEAALEVLSAGPLALIQDRGRAGVAHLGVTGSGAADRAALDAANRLVGNAPSAAAVEILLGGWRMRALRPLLVAVTGAEGAVRQSRRGTTVEHPVGCSVSLETGDELEIAVPAQGLRSYLALRHGIDAPHALGSRSRDTLSGIGPPPLQRGAILSLADDARDWPAADLVPALLGREWPAVTRLDVLRGPRDSLLDESGWTALLSSRWTVGTASDRVGLRLDGEPVPGAVHATLPSEGVVAGAVQLPPDGRPVLFLRDHPVTGGYPVVAVLTETSIDAAAQLRPGDPAHLALARRSR